MLVLQILILRFSSKNIEKLCNFFKKENNY